MASILVTGCEEDGADQSANAASGLTSPCPPAVPRISLEERVCIHGNGEKRSFEKSRLTCVPRVGGQPLGARSRRYIPDGQAHTSAYCSPVWPTTANYGQNDDRRRGSQRITHLPWASARWKQVHASTRPRVNSLPAVALTRHLRGKIYEWRAFDLFRRAVLWRGTVSLTEKLLASWNIQWDILWASKSDDTHF